MTLFDMIDEAESVDGLLLNVLQNHIPLHSIKSLIKNELSRKSEKSMRKILYTETDLTDVIPMDICQHILTFAALEPSIKSVSKSFHAMVDQNRVNWIRKWRATRIAQSPPIPEQHHTFYVDPAQNPLTQQQLDRGIHGPIRSMMDAMDIMKSGDKLILCEGIHRYDNIRDCNLLKKDMDIEGIGKCCITLASHVHVCVQKKLSLNNITVTINEGNLIDCGFIYVDNGGALRLNNCRSISCCWSISSEASMECDRCLFSLKQHQCNCYGIRPRCKSSVALIDCRFEAHPSTSDRMLDHSFSSYSKMSLKLIGCCFRENGRPYRSKSGREGWEARNSETSCIMYNRLVSSDTPW